MNGAVDEKWNVEQLREECRRLGIYKGNSHLRKAELILHINGNVRRNKKKARNKGDPKERGGGGGGGGRGARGPLASKAQEKVEEGPRDADGPGYVYVYYEPSRRGKAGREWKIGETGRDLPERRMYEAAARNGKYYQLKESWHVPYRKKAERVVHLDLADFRLSKKERTDGTGCEDGGKEWFGGDYDYIRARIKLAVRSVNAIW